MTQTQEVKKGELLIEGKTKKIWSVEDNPELVIIENKDDITKNDDPSQTKKISGKASLATATTCAIFKLLKEVGVPVAYEKKISQTEFLAPKVTMIPLEIIWRRYAVGSFLKRNPQLTLSKRVSPFRFHRSFFELFLKTTGGKISCKNGVILGKMPEDILKKGYLVYDDEFPKDMLEQINQILSQRIVMPVDDPFISNPYESNWNLKHPKIPDWDKRSDLALSFDSGNFLSENVTVKKIERLLREVGLVLEGAWLQLGCRLIDFKIEMGITSEGQLVVADVIDADSWRLRDSNWDELSKQLFRDNADMDHITDKYVLVARLVRQLRISKQAIVFWRGSENDPLPDIPKIPGVCIEDVVISGHKSPTKCLCELEILLTKYPEGGVILAVVGMSNGLGPILASRTNWPVIGVSITAKEKPEDVWSSLRMPSQVPMMTVLSPENAVLAAVNVLAQKNPAAYAFRQMAIEKLDA